MVTTVIPAVPYRRDADRSTGSSTGSAWRSSPRAASTSSCSSSPTLVLRNTTVTGGDTGAHVWFPDFLIDHFLPWRVAGWSPDFYAGFPAGQFYFPFPAVLIVDPRRLPPVQRRVQARHRARARSAFPVGAYVFARGIRVPRPAAPLFAVAATAFLFFKAGGDATMTFDFHIMGGTLPAPSRASSRS